MLNKHTQHMALLASVKEMVVHIVLAVMLQYCGLR